MTKKATANGNADTQNTNAGINLHVHAQVQARQERLFESSDEDEIFREREKKKRGGVGHEGKGGEMKYAQVLLLLRLREWQIGVCKSCVSERFVTRNPDQHKTKRHCKAHARTHTHTPTITHAHKNKHTKWKRTDFCENIIILMSIIICVIHK